MIPNLSTHDTLGPLSIGFSISCVVFGIFTTQVYIYFNRYPLDKPVYKYLVVLLWSLELLDQFFVGYSVYYYTVTNFNNVLVIIQGDIIWTLIIQTAVGCLVGTIVKSCFALRVWKFSKRNTYITGAIVFMVVTQLALAIVYCVRAFALNKLYLADRLMVVASLALGAGVLTDFLVAAALCYYLRQLRTGFRQSDNLIKTLTIYAVNTGALTGAVGLFTIILYDARPGTLSFMGTYFTLGKLYAISFLCTLNTRRVIRGRGTDQGSTNTSNAHNGAFILSPNHGRPTHSQDTSKHLATKSVEIGVLQEVSVKMEMEMDDVNHLPPLVPKRPKNFSTV